MATTLLRPVSLFPFFCAFVCAHFDNSYHFTHYSKNYSQVMMAHLTNQCHKLKKTLSEWAFNSHSLLQLPVDSNESNYVRRNIKGAVFSKVKPTPLKHKVRLVSCSDDVLINILDMDPEILDSEEFVEFVAGNNILDSCVPVAHRYGGHQFGNWAMQLGDGRAHLLGEYINSKGEHWELQIKGSGLTPYSRDGDGRAVLRSSIREFLCSEAMYHLGVPTSRAATIVMSSDPIMRDQFYDGHPELEKAAVVLRVAPTWFRFGSLELLARQAEIETLRILTDFLIREHFPQIDPLDEDRYLQLFSEVAKKTLELVAMWQGVGFTHGVLNTDNMSLLSITIDYGPFGLMDSYVERYTPNHSDDEGRYCYIKQPQVVVWNLVKLAQSLTVLMSQGRNEELMEMVNKLGKFVENEVSRVFRKKLGLSMAHRGDPELIKQLLDIMHDTRTDFTMGFRQLGEVAVSDLLSPQAVEGKWALATLTKGKGFPEFVSQYRQRLALERDFSEEKRQTLMMAHNPRYVLRQWMAQSAIKKADDYDFSEVNFILEVLKNPFTYQEAAEEKGYSSPPPCWAKSIKLSCSS